MKKQMWLQLHLLIRLLAVCEGNVGPSTEDASPRPSGQVQNNPIGLTCAYFWGPASLPSSACPHNHALQRPLFVCSPGSFFDIRSRRLKPLLRRSPPCCIATAHALHRLCMLVLSSPACPCESSTDSSSGQTCQAYNRNADLNKA